MMEQTLRTTNINKLKLGNDVKHPTLISYNCTTVLRYENSDFISDCWVSVHKYNYCNTIEVISIDHADDNSVMCSHGDCNPN